MSNYMLLPMPPAPSDNHSFVTWENGFTEEELDIIEKYCESLEFDKAVISDVSKDADYKDIRESKTAWVGNELEIAWLYDRMAEIARQLNSQFYRFDLYGFHEHFQYTIYDSNDKGHYNWHIDSGHNTNVPRKLSLVLQLSDPDSYEGGDLQVRIGSQPDTVLKQRGLIAAFPSYRLHRVTPVTKGVRKTLVIWVGGPAFR